MSDSQHVCINNIASLNVRHTPSQLCLDIYICTHSIVSAYCGTSSVAVCDLHYSHLSSLC